MCITRNRILIAGKQVRLSVLLLGWGSDVICLPLVWFFHSMWINRDECGCTPVRYFAILSMQRSGSGWFETLLNNHTNISSNGEIFSVKVRRSNVSTIVETLDQIYNLDWLSSASKNECTAAVGLKWMLNQVRVSSCIPFNYLVWFLTSSYICV